MSAKLRVVWWADRQKFHCSHRHCNVTGLGDTPGEAIRNWQFWYNIPY